MQGELPLRSKVCIYFAFTEGLSMGAGNYCRRAASSHPCNEFTCSWHGGNSSHCNTWSKIAIKVPSVVSGDRETLSSSSHLSWWNFHPFWSQVFRKLLPYSITCPVLRRGGCAVPSLMGALGWLNELWIGDNFTPETQCRPNSSWRQGAVTYRTKREMQSWTLHLSKGQCFQMDFMAGRLCTGCDFKHELFKAEKW